MSLSYREEMRVTEAFLDQFKLRLFGKSAPVLPDEGQVYHGDEVHKVSLPGSLGGLPDPLYEGPQPPNAMGMVLLVSPDDDGVVECAVSGKFDVVHRYIPDLEVMKNDLLYDQQSVGPGQPMTRVPRSSQIITVAYVRHTVVFNEIKFRFDVRDAARWMDDQNAVNAVLLKLTQHWAEDERIIRLCSLLPSGGAKFNFTWTPEALESQEGLKDAVYNDIIDNAKAMLPYDVRLRGRLRPAPSAFGESGKSRFLLEVYLQNYTRRDDARPYGVEKPYLLDAGFRVQQTAGFHHDVPHRLQPEDFRYIESDGLPGYGVSCAVEYNAMSDEFFTNSMPTCAQQRIDTPPADAVGMTYAPSYGSLASDPVPVLDDFVAALERYQLLWNDRIKRLAEDGLLNERDIAQKERDSFAAEVDRIRDGVDLIKKDDSLRRCFQWMNEAMGNAVALQGKRFAGWHLFQLGFILTQARSIYERFCDDGESRRTFDFADVLWFATGGGKTEAYLGIISWGMLYSRLMGKLYGVSAWMRFPLRMLSVQQFQRLSFVIAQSNVLRQREGLAGDPFTLGFYTGRGTPGSISSTMGNNADDFLATISEERLRGYQFISDCPYCGTIGSVAIKADIANTRARHACGNSSCWSNTESEAGDHGIRGEIGVYISDEEVYRYLPSVLVGTVDKLAVIAHNKRFSHFFGGAKYRCPEHGYSQTSICKHRRIVLKGSAYESEECGNNTRTTKVRVKPVLPMKSPGFDFLVQDELHLLKESLGNFDAHYESLMTALQVAHGGRPAKNLAATATIKDYEDHIHHLYFKNAIRFPAPGVNQGESFYARKAFDRDDQAEIIRRWFVGVLPLGQSMRAVAFISSAFLDQVDAWMVELRDGVPQWLLDIGFAASQKDNVLSYVECNLNTELIYVNRKRSIQDIIRHLESIDSPEVKERRVIQLDAETPLEDILKAIHHVETKSADDKGRQIIATSVVSHGVDIARLNFMVVAGWPKSTSEYIQSSARSGRVFPGIVFSVLSTYQLYESNVFLNFYDFHFFIERLVDSVPINRFAPNVIDRTLPGVMSAVLINWAPYQSWGKDLTTYVKPLVDCFKGPDAGTAKDAIRNVVLEALRLPITMAPHFDPRIVDQFNASLDSRVKEALHRLEHWSAGKMDFSISNALGDIFTHAPMISFRDIENQVLIKKYGSSSETVLGALSR